MGLKTLTKKIVYLEHETSVDRPMLAYIQGDRYALAIDAGYSKSHVDQFYHLLQQRYLKRPDFTVLTHWHFDHSLGLHATDGISIAHELTNRILKDQQKLLLDPNFVEKQKRENPYFEKEYRDIDQVVIETADFTYQSEMTIDLGHLTAIIFHTPSPHSDDSTCIYIPEEKVLFLGDATCGDVFNGNSIDQRKLHSLIQTIASIDCTYCILSHCEPLTKDDLLEYLYSLETID